MNNTQKYTSLVDYSIQLGKAIREFDTMLYSKPPKQMGSFTVSLKALEDTLDNIQEAQKMLNQMKSLPSIDKVAQSDNKSAKKADELISSMKSELRANISRLKEQFLKQREICYKQYQEVSRHITDKEDKQRFNGDRAMKFRLMMHEYPHEIPFNDQGELEEYEIKQTRREHEEQEKQIDSISDFELQGTDKLESALSALTTILAMTPTDDLSKEVRKEVAQIKKALPPKTISIAKDSLERLRHSSHLLLDLEQISEIMKTTHKFMGSDGKLQKINKQLEALQPLLEQAIREERERNMDIKQERDDVQSKVDYATDAVRTYGDILDGNARLEQEQIQIRNNTHGLYAENERLKEDEKKANAEAHEIQMKPESRQTYEDAMQIEKSLERARNDRQAVKDNEAYMADKMFERAVATLPPEYTNMKKRLQSVSSLYQMQMTQSQELSTGGMSR